MTLVTMQMTVAMQLLIADAVMVTTIMTTTIAMIVATMLRMMTTRMVETMFTNTLANATTCHNLYGVPQVAGPTCIGQNYTRITKLP